MGDTLRVKVESIGATPEHGAIATVLLESVTDFDLSALEADIRAAGTSHGWKVAVDMSKVLLLGSAGLGLLLNLRKDATAHKGKFVLFGLSDDLMGVMKATKLNTLLTILKDRKAAIAALF